MARASTPCAPGPGGMASAVQQQQVRRGRPKELEVLVELREQHTPRVHELHLFVERRWPRSELARAVRHLREWADYANGVLAGVLSPRDGSGNNEGGATGLPLSPLMAKRAFVELRVRRILALVIGEEPDTITALRELRRLFKALGVPWK